MRIVYYTPGVLKTRFFKFQIIFGRILCLYKHKLVLDDVFKFFAFEVFLLLVRQVPTVQVVLHPDIIVTVFRASEITEAQA